MLLTVGTVLAFRFLRIAVAGWMNQHQLLVIDYLREENRILREQLGGRRLRFTERQHRRLTTRAKSLGRKLLAEMATIVTPETLVLENLILRSDRTGSTAVGFFDQSLWTALAARFRLTIASFRDAKKLTGAAR